MPVEGDVYGVGSKSPPGVIHLNHMFCPMVKGGAGDWLQATKALRNPYYGSKMLTCGETVRTFPTSGDHASIVGNPVNDHSSHQHHHATGRKRSRQEPVRLQLRSGHIL